jgi:hypothetical protein
MVFKCRQIRLAWAVADQIGAAESKTPIGRGEPYDAAMP